MWRPKEAEDAFDQCVASLQRGETVEACLAAFPHLAGDLAQLLAAAQALCALAGTPHDPAPALARIRARFLREVARSRRA